MSERDWRQGNTKDSTDLDSPRSTTPQELQRMLPITTSPTTPTALMSDSLLDEEKPQLPSTASPAQQQQQQQQQKPAVRSSSNHFVSSPLNPSSPSSSPPVHSRPGSQVSMQYNRIVSEESRALSTPMPSSTLNSQSSRGSMVLYRLASEDLLQQQLMPPKLAYNRDSLVSSSGDSFISNSGDSKYPSGFNTLGRGLVPYAYDPTLDMDDPPDEEDVLHDPKNNKYGDESSFSLRGFLNVGVLLLLIAGLLCLFVFYPVISHFKNNSRNLAIDGNIRINATGQATDDPKSVDPNQSQSILPSFSSATVATTSSSSSSRTSTSTTTTTTTTRTAAVPTDTTTEADPEADPTAGTDTTDTTGTTGAGGTAAGTGTGAGGATGGTTGTTGTTAAGGVVQKRSAPFFLPELIDHDTPASARYRTGFDGEEYDLVFSDEFNTPGRSFYPGDDPFWEAADLALATGMGGGEEDQARYRREQVTTDDGHLVLRLEREEEGEDGGAVFRSGMVQSWNKFCFTGGYVELSVVLPGLNANSRGYLPGAWTLGNLARAGYPATFDGVWPYSYNECDSAASGQRLSACTCADEDHPGPRPSQGRGAPEINIMRAHQNRMTGVGQVVSQSAVVAPLSEDYASWNTTTEDGVRVFDERRTVALAKRGDEMQQSVLGMSSFPEDSFQGSSWKKFTTLGFEYWSDPSRPEDGYITWQAGGEKTMRLGAGALDADREGGVGRRLISEEPMSIVFNLGVAANLDKIDLSTMTFPTEMWVDYVRVYQRKGEVNVGCSPEGYPTAEYIGRHMDQYSDPKLTKWAKTRPRNRLRDGEC